MKKSILILCQLSLLILFLVYNLCGSEIKVNSPDSLLIITISIENRITYSVTYNGAKIISPSPLSLSVSGSETLGINATLIKHKNQHVDTTYNADIPVKSKIIHDDYNESILYFQNEFQLHFRVYNDGLAYRFCTGFKDSIRILSELVEINFADDDSVYFPPEESFISHFERYYEYLKISEIKKNIMCSLPVLIVPHSGPKMLITEANLQDYPGMYMQGTAEKSFRGTFPSAPNIIKPGRRPDRDEIIEERYDYVAVTSGTRCFPWRVIIVAPEDKNLIESQMIYKLSPPLKIGDVSWIKPGKVAWDWWNANNIYGVDFKAGINTATYKYYIDFAAQYGLEYVILDEGWSETTDVLQVVPDIDIEQLCSYAAQKNVGIILWVLWKPLDQQLEQALDQYKKWGIKGIKVDFMQRDDQWMVNYYHRIAREAAKRHLLVDFHGAYKPCGLRRAYPNVITREGLRGLEQSKWNSENTPEHNVTLPFIRMVAGPMDYTPGAMINAQEKNFRPIYNRPMSMGTRCHQLAMYVIYESPLQMLCDSPSNYLRESECKGFLSHVPTVWDTTIVLDAKVGDYVLLARKNDANWYIGGMTDWSAREFEITLDFLAKGEHKILIYEDGVNADRFGNDYRTYDISISRGDKLNIKMAPGGGWVAIISKKGK